MTRVLLVEDNRADARLFGELLSEIPGGSFALTTVDTLAGAVAAVAEQDVVFLDLSLPDAHGISTVTALINAGRRIPVVVLTGNDDERVARDAMQAGAQDYLRKAEITPSLIARTAWYAVARKKAEENAHRLAASDEAVRRARFISGVTAAIGASLELTSVLRDVARLLVPTLGDFCLLDLVGRDGTVDRVAHGVADPAHEGTVRNAYRYAPGPANPKSPVLEVIRTRRTTVIEPLDAASYGPDTQLADDLRSLQMCSLMVTPLVARGRVVGAISYGMGPSRRHYDDDLRLLADEIGERIALAVDNGQLYASAQRAIRARDELLAVVSHDLRNPLGVVALALQLLEREPDALATALPRAQRGVDRIQRLIEDLLEVARIENGTLSVEPRPTDLSSVLEDTYELHRALAANKGIKLVRDIDPKIGPVLADRHRLSQALGNLIGNALKFTPAGGTIRLGAVPRGDEVAIAVVDSGPGIAREHLDHIFDRFWQRERRSDGVGLGLAIVKGIVDAHGGRIEVESTLGNGATFRIAIPRALPTVGPDLVPIGAIVAQ